MSFTGVDSLLENQSLLDLDIIPGKDLKWKSFFNIRSGDLGTFYFTDNEMDASAYLDSPHYQLCIPLNTHGQDYLVNGVATSQMFLMTPTNTLCAVFPRKFNELHFIFRADIFAEMAKTNEAYELLPKNKVFFYDQCDVAVWSEMLFSALNDASLNVDQVLRKFMDYFFEIHSLSNGLMSSNLKKSFFIKQLIPYLKENIYKDLAVTDMCQQFDVSRRSFESYFKKYFGNSPASHFKKMKLMRVRQEILSAKNGDLSNILSKFQNLHVAHFGQFYKRYFGETMTQTRSRKT